MPNPDMGEGIVRPEEFSICIELSSRKLMSSDSLIALDDCETIGPTESRLSRFASIESIPALMLALASLETTDMFVECTSEPSST